VTVPAWWRDASDRRSHTSSARSALSGTAAAGGKTALVGVQMAVDRIIKAGGSTAGQSSCSSGLRVEARRRSAQGREAVLEDKIDFHVGGYLSNVCLACMPVYEEQQGPHMVSVCLDTTITTTKCSRYSFRAFDYAPRRRWLSRRYLVSKMGKKWHLVYLDYAWGQSTRDAYIEQIKKAGGETVETTGVPAQHGRHDAFLSKIQGNFDGIFAILFGGPAVTFVNQAYDLGLTKKYKLAGDGAVAESTHLPALGAKVEGSWASTATSPYWTRAQHALPQEVLR